MMNTPIVDFVKKYAESNSIRLHMPGHKGKGELCEKLDITEIVGADDLYAPSGIIAQSESNASNIFGASTFYSTEGCTHAIRAMLYLLLQYAKKEGKNPLIVATRNAHKSFITSCALLDLDVSWIFPKTSTDLLSCDIKTEDIENYFSMASTLPCALYVTSPDYLGNVLDVASISKVCKKYGVLLLVDNAHGAYLKFLSPSMHPIDLGADMCCDSAHKTLSTLTGGAYLHLAKSTPKYMVDKAKNALALFGSTSPSYLILQSLDKTNLYLSSNFNQKLGEFIIKVNELKDDLTKKGYTLIGNEPLKITIDTKKYGYLGSDFATFLKDKNIIVEYFDRDYVVLMLSLNVSDQQLEYLRSTLCSFERLPKICQTAPTICRPKKQISIRQAIMGLSQTISVKEALGKICAVPSVTCPPAIPIVVSGEVIDKNAIECFNYYGIETISVLTE